MINTYYNTDEYVPFLIEFADVQNSIPNYDLFLIINYKQRIS